ncbi:acetylxylan esterase [Streptomyces sp. NPDC056568]
MTDASRTAVAGTSQGGGIAIAAAGPTGELSAEPGRR